MARVKSFELRKKNREELLKQVTDLKNELAQHRVAKVTAGAPSKLAKIKDIRRSIARTLTVYNETQRAELKNHFKKAKRKPLDLRPKLTRTLRRRLLPSEEAKMTLRQKKRLQHFGPRKFAVKN
jgi:large subunit ribosomal protein L35e